MTLDRATIYTANLKTVTGDVESCVFERWLKLRLSSRLDAAANGWVLCDTHRCLTALHLHLRQKGFPLSANQVWASLSVFAFCSCPASLAVPSRSEYPGRLVQKSKIVNSCWGHPSSPCFFFLPLLSSRNSFNSRVSLELHKLCVPVSLHCTDTPLLGVGFLAANWRR